MDIKKEIANSYLQRIANVLLLNTNLTNDLSLRNGKMGLSIFFYNYSQYAINRSYNRYAGELVDEIYKELNLNLSVDFAKGIMGIGWGIEYLVKNKFVEAETDEIFGEIDNLVFRTIMDMPVLITNQTDLFGFGLYYLARLKPMEIDNLENLRKKHMLIHLLDNCEWMLTKEEVFNVKIPSLTITQLNSILYFLINIKRLNLFPTKITKFELYLPKYIMEKAEAIPSEMELCVFKQLLSIFSKDIIDKEINNNYHQTIKQIDDSINAITHTEESILQEFISSRWSSLIYSVNLCNDLNYKKLCKKALAIITNEGNWCQQLDLLNKDNLGLYGLAGLGMAILNEMN